MRKALPMSLHNCVNCVSWKQFVFYLCCDVFEFVQMANMEKIHVNNIH